MRFLRDDQTLNKIELIKQKRHPLEVYGPIIDTYSKDLSAMDDVPGLDDLPELVKMCAGGESVEGMGRVEDARTVTLACSSGAKKAWPPSIASETGWSSVPLTSRMLWIS